MQILEFFPFFSPASLRSPPSRPKYYTECYWIHDVVDAQRRNRSAATECLSGVRMSANACYTQGVTHVIKIVFQLYKYAKIWERPAIKRYAQAPICWGYLRDSSNTYPSSDMGTLNNIGQCPSPNQTLLNELTFPFLLYNEKRNS